MPTLTQMAKESRLSFGDIEWLTGGVITKTMLDKHSQGVRELSPENFQIVTRLIASHRAWRNGIALLVNEKKSAT